MAKENTKIEIEMTGFKYSAEINHDANIDEMIDLFKALLISHKFSENCILDGFARHSFDSYEEIKD